MKFLFTCFFLYVFFSLLIALRAFATVAWGQPSCATTMAPKMLVSDFWLYSEVAKKSVSARPVPILEGTLGSRMGPGRPGMAPTSGPGWVRNTAKQSTWRIWMGPLGPGMGPGRAQDRTQARVWMAPPETVTDFQAFLIYLGARLRGRTATQHSKKVF